MKKLPRSVTVASLRLLLEKLFRVKGRAQSLFLRAPGDPLPEPLGDDNDQRPLSFFGVQARVLPDWRSLVDRTGRHTRGFGEGCVRRPPLALAPRRCRLGQSASLSDAKDRVCVSQHVGCRLLWHHTTGATGLLRPLTSRSAGVICWRCVSMVLDLPGCRWI